MKLSDFLSFTPDGFFRSNKRSLKKYLSSGGVISSINDINDVNVIGAVNGDALVYQGGEWVPGNAGSVDSVNGQTGVVNLTKSDIGLSNVDNTSDLSKPISTATQTALNNKANSVHTHTISDVSGLQTALDGKASTGALSTLQTAVDGKAPIAAAVITGGSTGQVLKKASNANYDLVWAQDESTIYVATYADLPDPTTVSGKTYGVLASTGIAYISVLFGGNFRAKGFYYSDGTQWIYIGEFPMQASSAEVQAGTVTDKFVAPNTLRGGYFYNGGNSFGGNSTIGTNDAFSLILKTNNTNRLFIFSDGNASLGNSNNEGFKLDVQGTGRFTGRLDLAGKLLVKTTTESPFDDVFINGNTRTDLLGVGSTSDPNSRIRIGGSITGGSTSYGVFQSGNVSNNVTATGVGFRSQMHLAAGTALSNIVNYWATRTTDGAGSSSSITIGYWADISLGSSASANAWGFVGSLNSGSGRWNLYMQGTAANYLAGKLLIGTTTDSGFQLDVNGTTIFRGDHTIRVSAAYNIVTSYNAGTNAVTYTVNGTGRNYQISVPSNFYLVINGTRRMTTLASGNTIFGTGLTDNGFKVEVEGTLKANSIIATYTPTSSTDSTLPTGSMCADDSFLYRRDSTGTWKKIAWTTF